MALQDLSLRVIVNTFDRYVASAISPNDEFKHMLDFLKRIYSPEISSLLCNTNQMKCEYINFLINEHLKILDTGWFKTECSWKTLAARLVEVHPNLEIVHFHMYLANTQWQDIFQSSSNLKVMSFQKNCCDEILKCVSKCCPNIEEIDIRGSKHITCKGFRYLCIKQNDKVACSNLKRLFIEDCTVTRKTVKCLIKNLPSLEVIDCYGVPKVLFFRYSNGATNYTYNLTNLDLISVSTSSIYTGLLTACISLCPRLKSLSCVAFDQEHLDLICQVSNLEELYLIGNLFDLDKFITLRGSKLISLTIIRCSLTISSLAKSCPNLKQLNLDEVSFNGFNDATPVFHNLKAVSFVDLTGTPQMNASRCFVLSSSPVLQSVTFNGCPVSGYKMKSQILKCSECCKVKEIKFINVRIELQFLKDILVSCFTLKCLRVIDCDLKPDEVQKLYNFSRELPNKPFVCFTEEVTDFLENLTFKKFCLTKYIL